MTAREVKDWRRTMGINQEQLDQRLGLARGTVGRIEAGELEPPKWMALARRGWEATHDLVEVKEFGAIE